MTLEIKTKILTWYCPKTLHTSGNTSFDFKKLLCNSLDYCFPTNLAVALLFWPHEIHINHSEVDAWQNIKPKPKISYPKGKKYIMEVVISS